MVIYLSHLPIIYRRFPSPQIHAIDSGLFAPTPQDGNLYLSDSSPGCPLIPFPGCFLIASHDRPQITFFSCPPSASPGFAQIASPLLLMRCLPAAFPVFRRIQRKPNLPSAVIPHLPQENLSTNSEEMAGRFKEILYKESTLEIASLELIYGVLSSVTTDLSAERISKSPTLSLLKNTNGSP